MFRVLFYKKILKLYSWNIKIQEFILPSNGPSISLRCILYNQQQNAYLSPTSTLPMPKTKINSLYTKIQNKTKQNSHARLGCIYTQRMNIDTNYTKEIFYPQQKYINPSRSPSKAITQLYGLYSPFHHSLIICLFLL